MMAALRSQPVIEVMAEATNVIAEGDVVLLSKRDFSPFMMRLFA
jgi:hypothetical protein